MFTFWFVSYAFSFFFKTNHCQSRYGKALREKPLRTKAMTAFVMSGLSNAITQIITKRYKFKESFWYGVQCCPPYAHFVYKLIDRLFGEGPENSVRFSAKNFNRHFKRSMRFIITAHVFIGSCGFVKKKL
jgi:hypothetical protein